MPPDNVLPLPDPENDLNGQAMRWVVRLNSGEATRGDREAFSLWIRQNEEHRQAFFAARRLWREMAFLDRTEETIAARLAPDRLSRPAPSRTTQRLLLGAAAFAVIAILSFAIQPNFVRFLMADYRTAVGEIKSLKVSDGSTIHLNTDSLLAANFTDTERSLELLAGEAEFEAAPDPGRPFVVKAGVGSIRALGTRFVVRMNDGRVRVSVLEHAVEIRSSNHAAVTLGSGYQLEYGAQGLLDGPKAILPAGANGWRTGNLKFDARPLHEVLAEIDRYVPGKLLLVDDRLANHEVSGVFEIKNLNRAAPLIAKSLNLRISGFDGLLVFLY